MAVAFVAWTSAQGFAFGAEEQTCENVTFTQGPAAVAALERRLASPLRAEVERAEGVGRSWTGPLLRVYVEGQRGGGYAEYRLDGKRGRVLKW